MQRRNSCYNYKNYKGNFLTPFLERKTVIIVYVHGFLGNNNTFHDFPELLEQAMKLYNVKIINKVFPAFETNGIFEEFVDYIISWIYSQTEDYPIILMGHSMGGILVADVYRKISKGDVIPEYKSKKSPKIVGVFGFDTPYFGVSSSIANAGVRKIKESFTSASNYVASYLTNSYVNDMDNDIKLIEGPSTEKSETMYHREPEPEPEPKNSIQRYDSTSIATTSTDTNTPSGGSRGWKLVSNLLLSTATIAAIGTSILHQDTRSVAINTGYQLLSESTQYIANYYRFLEPLIEITKQYKRVDDLINSSRRSIISGGERFKFKNYYPITQVKNNDGTVSRSTFICLPQELRYLKFFDPVPGPNNAPDVVFSHTKMFNSIKNPENTRLLADKCIVDLYKIIRTLY